MNPPSPNNATTENSASGSLFEAHPRRFEANRYVYPVLARRSGGISVGVNLNLDKVCNFNCVYCQVARSDRIGKEFVDLARLAEELDHTLTLVTSGRIYRETKFRDTPEALRRLNDVALSGDGEPTAYVNFDEVAEVCAGALRRHALDDVKLVLITNAGLLHRERVRRGLEILDTNHGEIWAKLDAGTEAYYRRIARSAVPFRQIIENLRQTAVVRPIVIQTLFMRTHNEPPAPAELEAYCDRLNEIVAGGGKIKLVQIHTVARPPAENWVSALGNEELDAIVERVRRRTKLPVAGFHGRRSLTRSAAVETGS